MKTMKRALAVLLALVLLCVGVPLAFAEGETAYQTGDLIQYGTYPQTKVTETTALQNAANAAVWKSYDYYTGTGSETDGNMMPGDYMKFADFFFGGAKFRAVKFTQYRPYYTGYRSDASYTYQDDNGYSPNTTYYFKYEPLTWRVLDPSTGYIMCESIVDSQAYQNTIYYNGSEYYQAVNSSVYANDYETSSIRAWLNLDFYETAFTAGQKENIKTTALNNDAYNSKYNSASTNDKIFLLSYADALNTSYSFSSTSSYDTARKAQGTDYAKCQGLWVSTSSDYRGNSSWRLRSPGSFSFSACYVSSSGFASDINVDCCYYGVRPACNISKLTSDISQSDNLFSAGSHEHIAGTPARENEQPATCTVATSYEAVTYCTLCGEEMSRETVYEGDSLGHIEQSFSAPSTCAENGFTITICTRCGETLSHEILPRLEHTWNDGEVTAEPTCTAQGVKTFTCSGCGATYTEPVDLLAHDWDDGVVTKEPSCTEAGEMTYTCATGGETRTEPIDKLDHKIVLVPGKAATCEEPGLTDGWQCETCQKWFAEQQPIEPTGHDMQIQAYVYPTCEEGGYAPFVCSRCGYTEKTDPEPALGHDYQPTYEWSADNSTVTASLVCTRCDDVQAKETVGTVCKTVEATCMNPGLLNYTSEGFANKAFYVQTKTIEIAQKPHMTMQIREVSPTCDKEGVGSYWTCSTCDGIFEDEAATRPLEEPPVLPKLSHTPGEPVTENETAATCTAEGSYDTVVYCFACGQELSRETIPTEKTPHADADNDGHCDACGEQMQGGDHCKVCGKIHNGGFFDKLTGFFHRIIGIFKR